MLSSANDGPPFTACGFFIGMRLRIVAVGRLADGPQATLASQWLSQAVAAASGTGIASIELVEVDSAAPPDPRAEALALYRATPDDARRVLLDRRGAGWSARHLADRLAAWRDERATCVVFWIGGDAGVSQSVRDQADARLAFGRESLSAPLARVMLAERLCDAVGLLQADARQRG